MKTKFIVTLLCFYFISIKAFSQTVTVTQTQLPAGKAQTNQRVLLMNITGSSGTLNTVTVTTSGSTTNADITKISVISTGTSNRFFSTQTVFGITSTIGTGNISITGSQALTNGSNNYFWITYDVASTATEGNVLDATLVSVKVGATTKSVNSFPTGKSVILLQHSVVFKSGDFVMDGGVSTASTYFRIPAIITAPNGDLITATDARFTTPNDLPYKADIIIRRSIDKGATWLAPQTIAEYGAVGAGDASLILDTVTNTIFCLFASDAGLAASTPSAPIRIRMSKSTDNGASWTTPIDLTNQIYGSGCANAITKNWYAVWISAGRHTQLKSGRLIAAAGVRPTSATTINNAFVYSDDHGATWSVTTTLTNTGAGGDGFTGDESKEVQLNNGNLLMSSRTSVAGLRKFRTSNDQGVTWGSYATQSNMDDPRCNGDIIRYSSTQKGANMNVIIHSLPDNLSARQNLTVFASQDEGATFPVLKTIFPGLAQYSSLTVLADNTIGIYYEMADPGAPFEMYFARFSLDYLGISGFKILPVNFISFEGQLLPTNEVKLKWKAETDNDFSHFEIERSLDGNRFQTLGEVEKGKPFEFLDKHPESGINFYRLKAIDIDGSAKYSNVIKIIYNANATRMVLFPNPASENLTIKLITQKRGTVNIQLVNQAGHIAYNKPYTINASLNDLNIDVSSLRPGVYFINARNNENELMSAQKFIKQ